MAQKAVYKENMSQNTIMPFGKYKGKDLLFIAENNPKYLIWLNSIELRGTLKTSVNDFVDSEYFIDCLHEFDKNEVLEDHGLSDDDFSFGTSHEW